MLPLAWALRGAGHQVLVAVPDSLTPQVRAAGFDTASLSFESDTTHLIRAALRQVGPDAVPVEAWPRPDEAFWVRIAARFAANARGAFADYLAVARRWSPDLIMCDPMEAAGRMVAGCLDIPVVLHRWGLDVTAGGFLVALSDLLGPDCRALGLPGLPEPDLLVDPCPAGLQLPGVPAGRRVRYVPANGSGALPDWAGTPARSPRICVTMGTKVSEFGLDRVVRWMLEGIDRMGEVEIVLALPLAEAYRGPAADRVVATGPVPLGLVLDRCDVVVHHGGHGTGLTAAGLGVPQLVLPQLADQFEFARRAEEYGIGRRLDTARGQRDPDLVRDALDALLADGEHRAAARRLADEIRRTPPPASLVPELERLAARRPEPVR
jgi:hypothetical protein